MYKLVFHVDTSVSIDASVDTIISMYGSVVGDVFTTRYVSRVLDLVVVCGFGSHLWSPKVVT